MPAKYEIEIKSLLGTKANADSLKAKLLAKNKAKLVAQNKQLNHYFIGGNLPKFKANFESHILPEKKDIFEKIVTKGKNISVRTRQADARVILVIKASMDDTTSSNGITRMEFEQDMKDMTLDMLDKLLLKSGFEYQAKWSREREEYKMGGTHICIDKNAGYGYLAEFEQVIEEASEADKVKEELRQMMADLGVEELKQDRLERMFAHYNKNWKEYYGTDKTFIIE